MTTQCLQRVIDTLLNKYIGDYLEIASDIPT